MKKQEKIKYLILSTIFTILLSSDAYAAGASPRDHKFCEETEQMQRAIHYWRLDPNEKNSPECPRCPLIHSAAKHGCTKMARILIEYGAKVNVRDFWGMLPIHYAPRYGDKELLSLLKKHGNSVNAKAGNIKLTPLHVAYKYENKVAIDFLIANGADENARLEIDGKEGKIPSDFGN